MVGMKSMEEDNFSDLSDRDAKCGDRDVARRHLQSN
jgi:hypothetical protein